MAEVVQKKLQAGLDFTKRCNKVKKTEMLSEVTGVTDVSAHQER